MEDREHLKTHIKAALETCAKNKFSTRFLQGYHIDRDDRTEFLDTLVFCDVTESPTDQIQYTNASSHPFRSPYATDRSRSVTEERTGSKKASAGVSSVKPKAEVGIKDSKRRVSVDKFDRHTGTVEFAPKTTGQQDVHRKLQIREYKVYAKKTITVRVYPLKHLKRGAAVGAGIGATTGTAGGGAGGAAAGVFFGALAGSFIPIAGNIVGGILGGIAGAVGGAALGGGLGGAGLGSASAGIGASKSYSGQYHLTVETIFKQIDPGSSEDNDFGSGYYCCTLKVDRECTTQVVTINEK